MGFVFSSFSPNPYLFPFLLTLLNIIHVSKCMFRCLQIIGHICWLHSTLKDPCRWYAEASFHPLQKCGHCCIWQFFSDTQKWMVALVGTTWENYLLSGQRKLTKTGKHWISMSTWLKVVHCTSQMCSLSSEASPTTDTPFYLKGIQIYWNGYCK